MNARLAIFMLCSLGLGLAVLGTATAATLYGAAPSTLRFDGGGEGLLRGTTAERSVSIQNQGDGSMTFTLTLEGPQAEWLHVGAATVAVPPGARVPVTVSASVPSSSANGDYTARLRVTPQANHGPGGEGASSAVVQELVIPITIVVSDTQTLRVTVNDWTAPDGEQGMPMVFEAHLTNDGNVEARPQALIRVFDADGIEEIARFTATADAIAPGSSAIAAFEGPSDLPADLYLARIEMTLPGGELRGPDTAELAFTIHAPGALGRSGEVTGVSLPTSVLRGDLIPARVTFTNTGTSPINAHPRITVERDGRTIDVLEGTPRRLQPGETVTFEEFVRADEPGTYTVRGEVLFDGKSVPIAAHTITVEDATTTAAEDDDEAPAPKRRVPGLAPLLLFSGAGAAARLRRWRR